MKHRSIYARFEAEYLIRWLVVQRSGPLNGRSKE